jgi:hypothetical protein
MGFAWQDRTLVRPRLLAGLVAFGILAFTGLTWLGPYPVSMIGEPGAHVKNTSPPSAALLAYECAQTGLLVIIAPAVSRRLAGPVAGRAVDRANRVVMTVFLWHMAPVAILGSVLYATGALPQPAAGSIEWWVLRPVWIAALTAVLIPLVFALSRLEARLVRHLPTLADPDGLAGPFALPVLCAGIVLAGFALYRFAVAGFAPDGRLPVLALVSFVVGVLLVVALPRGPAR